MWNIDRRECLLLSVRSSRQSTVDVDNVVPDDRSGIESTVSRLLSHCDSGKVCCRFITSAVSICQVWLTVSCLTFTYLLPWSSPYARYYCA